MEKKHLLQIEPYVHITNTSNSVLFYNTLNGRFIESNNKTIVDIVKQEHVLFDDVQLKQKYIAEFISSIQEFFIGELIDVGDSLKYPAHIKPNINIKKSISFLQDNELDYDESFNNYLDEVTIYLNNNQEDTGKFSEANKQFIFPISNAGNYCEVDYDKLINFINQSYSFGLTKINLVAGELFKYKRIKDLLSYIHSLNIQCSVYQYFNQVEDDGFNEEFETYIEQFNVDFKLLVTCPLNLTRFKKFVEVLPVDKLTLIFILCDNLEFEFIENAIVDNFNKYSYQFQPFYTGSNIDFFKDSVYLEKDDLFCKKFKLKDLSPKTILNLNKFGKLSLLNNGRIYTNLNHPEIGKLEVDDLSSIIKKALTRSNFGWMKTRKTVMPCMKCMYNDFCPSISNYEYAIGKYNLCHVYEN